MTSGVIVVFVLLLLAFTTIFLILIRSPEPEQLRAQPSLVPPPPEVDLKAVADLLPPDSIQSIDNPQFETIQESEPFMELDERVIGLVINGDARAYPIKVLSSHEIVNDIVGEEPVAITWCPLCFSALVFSRKVNGIDAPLIFGVSGKLLYETLIMFDRQTGSLWSQLYGAAIDGEHSDKRLAFFSSALTEWSAWQREYPNTLVLSKEKTCAQFNCGAYAGDSGGPYQIDPYESYYNTSNAGVINNNIPREDKLGEAKRRILGIRMAGIARAYPFSELTKTPVINDLVDGIPVLIAFDPATETASAYLRTIDDRTFTFRSDSEDSSLIIDEESGSQWLLSTGTAVSGAMKDSQLPTLIATTAFGFGWYDYFPNSETFEPEVAE